MPIPNLTPDRRREFAQLVNIDEQYLYQIIRGMKVAAPALARRIHEIDPAFLLQDLRPDDWHLIWPELIGVDGSPAAQQKAA